MVVTVVRNIMVMEKRILSIFKALTTNDLILAKTVQSFRLYPMMSCFEGDGTEFHQLYDLT